MAHPSSCKRPHPRHLHRHADPPRRSLRGYFLARSCERSSARRSKHGQPSSRAGLEIRGKAELESFLAKEAWKSGLSTPPRLLDVQ